MKNLILQTILGGLRGPNNEGSSKRWAAFTFTALAVYLTLIYGAMYVYVVIMNDESNLHKSVESLMWPMVGTIVSTILSALSVTAWEKKIEAKKEVEINTENKIG